MTNDTSFLGTGWSFPPTFKANGTEVELVGGEADIHESLQIILSTRVGERVMQDTFGSDLTHVLFEEVDRSLVNSVQQVVADALLYHEPRIKLDSVDVSQDDIESGLLLISITYTIRSTNSRFNMVYPFYLNEQNSPGV